MQKQAAVRGFRLLPVTLGCALFSYAVYAIGWSFHRDIAEAAGIPWAMKSSYYAENLSWAGAVRNGTWEMLGFGAWMPGWCVPEIVFGSYLVNAFLLFFGQLKRRICIYMVLFAVSFFFPYTTGFLAGIAAAFAVSLPVILLVTELFYRLIEIPTGKLTGKLWNFLSGNGEVTSK